MFNDSVNDLNLETEEDFIVIRLYQLKKKQMFFPFCSKKSRFHF